MYPSFVLCTKHEEEEIQQAKKHSAFMLLFPMSLGRRGVLFSCNFTKEIVEKLSRSVWFQVELHFSLCCYFGMFTVMVLGCRHHHHHFFFFFG